MKNLLTVLACLCLLHSPIFSQKKSKPTTKTPPPAVNTRLDLTEALRQKLIAVDITGLGGYRGEAIKIVCKNLSGRALRVQIPQGQLMKPADTSAQTLVVAEEKWLSLNAKTPAEVLLRTFCAEAGDGSPMVGSAFSLGALAPENLRSLLQFLVEKNKLDSEGAQHAVWCVANGHALGSIGDREIAKFTAELLGKTLPGYRIKYEVVETPGARQVLGKALKVEGNYIYFLEKKEKLSLILFDAAGKPIKTLFKDKEYVAGEHRSSLNLEVYNLKPGKYFVRLQTAKAEVVKEIEVEF